MSLEDVSLWTPEGNLGIYEPIPPILSLRNKESSGLLVTPFLISAYCGGLSPLHPIYASTIQTILRTTGSPALAAAQAFITMIYQSFYYDQFPTLDISADANVTSWIRVSVPVQWTGFIVVYVLTGAHTLLVLGILVAFTMSTKYIKLNDPWMIFAYTSSGELADIIEEARQLKVADHVKMIEEQGRDTEMLRYIKLAWD
ncbi:hypothetical protein F5Y13DRAFT_188606 [Hypoxylon sp. FL1857]|nr:hypothetical protein F5Y13DRAFT_188606 [Hypoxylon sp. FL1857]